MQMLFLAVLVDAAHAALEDREVALDGVAMDGQPALITDVLASDVHRKVAWFVEKWTTAMDLNKRDAAELSGDLAVVMQAVHLDASRDTHALLAKAMAAMPAPVFVTKTETK